MTTYYRYQRTIEEVFSHSGIKIEKVAGEWYIGCHNGKRWAVIGTAQYWGDNRYYSLYINHEIVATRARLDTLIRKIKAITP